MWKFRNVMCHILVLTAHHKDFVTVFMRVYTHICGPGYSSRIATRYGLDDPRFESQRFFRTRPDQPWDPLSLLYNGYRVFPGGEATGAWR